MFQQISHQKPHKQRENECQEKNQQFRLLYLEKSSFKNEGKINAFSDKKELRNSLSIDNGEGNGRQPTPVSLPGKSHGRRSLVGCSTWSRWVRRDWANSLSLFTFHALEKEMATHSSVLAWRIPGTREPDGLPSMGSHRVGHDWNDLAEAASDSRCKMS